MGVIEVAIVVLAVLLGGYGFIFGFLRRLNGLIYVSRLGGKRAAALPPGDMSWPLAGKMWLFLRAFLSEDPDSFLSSFISRYGRTGIYKTHLFGKPSIIVCKPDTCRRVLIDDERFEHGYPKATEMLFRRETLHKIFCVKDKRLRRMIVAPITGSESLSLYMPRIEQIILNSLEEWSSSERPVEFQTEIKKAMLKVITDVFFGSDQMANFNFTAMESLYTDMARGMFTLPINLPGFAFHSALKARGKLFRMIQGIIGERVALKQKNVSIASKNVLDMLMEVDDEDGKKLDEDTIIGTLLTYLLAGHETTSHAAMWATLFLQEHPDILQKAKEEQQEIVRARPTSQSGLTFKEIRQMTYLAKVVDEALRRTSVLFSVFRQAKTDVIINGYLVPKGWKVMVNIRGVHMDPDNYMDPKEFDPSRWENITPKVGTFLPFGLGSRSCPGSELARLEMSIFLHKFLLHYKVERLNPKSPVVYLPIMNPLDKCLAKFEKLP